MPKVHFNESWHVPLLSELQSEYFAVLMDFLAAEKAHEKQIYPQPSEWFRALDLTPLDRVRVVILGQDPYHGPGQAHGLCFSVQPGVRPPPSLVNIYKEIENDLGLARPRHGFLEQWARQGVLLLNSVLTVEAHQAASHQKKGWERFTDAIIRLVNDRPEPVVFLLWGAYAQRKAAFVDDVAKGGRHLILRAAHPSPLSAHNGFLGCRHFSQCNVFLETRGLAPINWALPDVVTPQ